MTKAIALCALARRAAVIAVLMVMSVSASAQDTLRPRYGIGAGVSINIHRADFRALPGVPNCCPNFESGSGYGPTLGLLAEWPIAPWLLFGLRVDYTQHDAELIEREPIRVIVNGSGRDGAFEHSVDATIASIGASPSLNARIADGFFVGVELGGGYVIMHDYSQAERIVEPSDAGTFLDSNLTDTRSRVRNQSAGAIPNAASLLLHAGVGLSYELPLNSRGTLLLVPHASYLFALTSAVDNINWYPDGVRAGITLKYSPAPLPIRRDSIVFRDTVTRDVAWDAPARVALDRAESDVDERVTLDTTIITTTIHEHYVRDVPGVRPMTCTVAASGVNADGVEEPIATLRIEEFLSTVAHPLLTFVFFDVGASDIPARYTKLTSDATSRFSSSELRSAGTLDIYRTMLNIVGERMRRNPGATLTLTGCNMDVAAEKGDVKLSHSRAESVRDYLAGVWAIAPGRLKTDAVGLPARKSNTTTADGQAENRRVEIASSDPSILDVVIIDDTSRVTSVPVIRLRPTITSAHGVAEWEMRVSQRGRVLKRFRGSGDAPEFVDWDLTNDDAEIPQFDEPISIALEATGGDARRTNCAMALSTQITTVQQKRDRKERDFTIDRYNLILFYVGDAGISPQNQRVVDLVKSRLKPSSQLTIEGFADRSGNPESNRRLSANRATTTAQALSRTDATTRGVGEDRLLHPNDTPEGRFYCRTVQILVKTPIQP